MQFIFGLIGSFVGGVAFGPINLSVVDLTLKKDRIAALRFSIAAALVEIVQATIAIQFGKLITKKIDEFPQLKLLVIAFFIVLGLYFIFKKDTPTNRVEPTGGKSNFLSGFIVSVFNIQIIPYWIFVLAYLRSAQVLNLKSWHLLLFLAGVSFGKLAILNLYSYLSEYIKNNTSNLNDNISKAIGVILLFVGLVQAMNYFFFRS